MIWNVWDMCIRCLRVVLIEMICVIFHPFFSEYCDITWHATFRDLDSLSLGDWDKLEEEEEGGDVSYHWDTRGREEGGNCSPRNSDNLADLKYIWQYTRETCILISTLVVDMYVWIECFLFRFIYPINKNIQ